MTTNDTLTMRIESAQETGANEPLPKRHNTTKLHAD